MLRKLHQCELKGKHKEKGVVHFWDSIWQNYDQDLDVISYMYDVSISIHTPYSEFNVSNSWRPSFDCSIWAATSGFSIIFTIGSVELSKRLNSCTTSTRLFAKTGNNYNAPINKLCFSTIWEPISANHCIQRWTSHVWWWRSPCSIWRSPLPHLSITDCSSY